MRVRDRDLDLGAAPILVALGEVPIVEEHSKWAKLDREYGLDQVKKEARWASLLGRDLAAWLGVPHIDELR